MLVLSRKKDEEVYIDGGRVVVSIIEIRGDRVRLGFTMPSDVVVDRREVHERKLEDMRNEDRT